MIPLCHPDRPHEARGLCRACYLRTRYAAHPEKARARARGYYAENREEVLVRVREYQATDYVPSPRLSAIHEADAELEAAVYAARGGHDGFQYGRLYYDEIMLRAMRRRKEAAARIDAEWPASHGVAS